MEESTVEHYNSPIKKPLALIILDGWGHSNRREGNAIRLAHTPYYDEICQRYPQTLLAASGERVGLDTGEPGNSEVGHTNIGAGRVVETNISRITRAVETGAFYENEVLLNAFEKKRREGAALHLIGLLSDGGNHSAPENLFSLLRMAKRTGIERVFVHCFLDGRDVAPRTADVYVEMLQIKLVELGIGQVATLCGRYYAMDRDENWERTARVFTMLVHSEGERAKDPITAIRNSYLRGIADEFIQPVVLENERGEAIGTVRDGDLVVYFNHRPDRMRQLVRSLSVAEKLVPAGLKKPKIDSVCLVEYDRSFNLPVAFKKEPEPNVLTKVFADRGILNCRVTESAKYSHITYFFNGGIETEHPCEQRVVIASPGEETHETNPEMGCFKVTDKLLSGLEGGENDVFIVNLGATDVVAHTGNLEKTIESVQFVDTCLGGILEKIRELDAIAVITSDHGNCEEMADLITGEPNNSHTANPVPFHLIDESANGIELRTDGALEDVAPTILGILGLDKPEEMTGHDLRIP